MRLTFSLHRFNPETDRRPRVEDYRLDVGRGATILDCLIRIKNELDGTLALRYSCRSAICGSCAMDINGSQKLACRTTVRRELERHGKLDIGPLRNLPVIKDLVADMSPFWSKVHAVTPWLASAAPAVPSAHLTPERTTFHNVDACIMCGACVGACAAHEVSRGFIGPAALAKAERFVADPRESRDAIRHRLTVLDQPDGIWDCTRCNLCVEVCPKDVKPMEAIIRLRRAALDAGLTSSGGARHITGFTSLIHQFGHLNEALMPIKIIGWNPFRAWRILPLGLKMLRHGKIPNPLGAPFPGIRQVQSIFHSARRRPGAV
jgi:succinate dehydrogenase / fumarate reductase iron-sulfur subunit